VAALFGVSYWTCLREIERGNLKAYRRPGKRIAIRADDAAEWAYGSPVEPRQLQTATLTPLRPSTARAETGSFDALDAIERRLLGG